MWKANQESQHTSFNTGGVLQTLSCDTFPGPSKSADGGQILWAQQKGDHGLASHSPSGKFSEAKETLSFFEDDLPSPATLSQEIELWRRKWTDHQTPPATLQETLKACNGQLYPNIKTVLQITATFPVTSCECERSISTLGIVKTKLRATMGQDRLTGLCLLSRHRDIYVEPRDIVKIYARKNPRRMVLPDILADDEETQWHWTSVTLNREQHG